MIAQDKCSLACKTFVILSLPMAQGTKIYNSLPKNTLKSVNFNQYEANNISHKWLSHHFAQMLTLWISVDIFNDLEENAWTIFLREKLISSICSCEVLENLLLNISNESFRMAKGEEEETWSCRQRNNLAMSFYEKVGCP